MYHLRDATDVQLEFGGHWETVLKRNQCLLGDIVLLTRLCSNEILMVTIDLQPCTNNVTTT